MYSYPSPYNNYDYENVRRFSETTSSGNDAVAGVMLAVMGVAFLVGLVVFIITAIGMWKMFVKAGRPGWAAIIPFYNQFVLMDIIGRPAWWVLLIPTLPAFGLWVSVIASIDTARAYGKSGAFAILLVLLPFIGYPILGLGASQYKGRLAAGLDDTNFMPAPVVVAKTAKK